MQNPFPNDSLFFGFSEVVASRRVSGFRRFRSRTRPTAFEMARGRCLDCFVVFGERHLNYLVQAMFTHYQEEWPHQGRNNQPLLQAGADPHKAARSGNRQRW